jgi:hypothetical protein
MGAFPFPQQFFSFFYDKDSNTNGGPVLHQNSLKILASGWPSAGSIWGFEEKTKQKLQEADIEYYRKHKQRSHTDPQPANANRTCSFVNLRNLDHATTDSPCAAENQTDTDYYGDPIQESHRRFPPLNQSSGYDNHLGKIALQVICNLFQGCEHGLIKRVFLPGAIHRHQCDLIFYL